MGFTYENISPVSQVTTFKDIWEKIDANNASIKSFFEAGSMIVEEIFTATEGQTDFILRDGLYIPKKHMMSLWVNGVQQFEKEGYEETSSQSFSTTTPLQKDDIVRIRYVRYKEYAPNFEIDKVSVLPDPVESNEGRQVYLTTFPTNVYVCKKTTNGSYKWEASYFMHGTTLQRPSANLAIGTPYFNTDSMQPEWWVGDKWVTSGDSIINTIEAHRTNTENPHSVTKEQVGLGNVDNTSDQDKPVSIATLEILSSHSLNSTHIPYIASTGTANTYSITLSPAPTSYFEGMAVSVKINVANTGASTINVNGLGAKSIKDINGDALTSNALKVDIPYTLRYTGTYFYVEGYEAIKSTVTTVQGSVTSLQNTVSANAITAKNLVLNHQIKQRMGGL